MNLGDLGSIASIVSLPAAAITVAAWLRSPGITRTLTLFIALPIAIAAYTVDISDRFGWIKLSEGPLTSDFIQGWGKQDNSLFMTVNSRYLLNYKDHFKLMLVLHIPYANIDRMTDAAIEKSSLYIITGSITHLPIAAPAMKQLRVIPPITNGEFNVLMDFNLVIVPNDTSAEQIRSLSDVERVGGKIILTHATNVGFIAVPTEKQAG
jgi:hypothetical protein